MPVVQITRHGLEDTMTNCPVRFVIDEPVDPASNQYTDGSVYFDCVGFQARTL